MAMFAAALVGAILRGRAGAPCACFGSRSTVGWRSVVRNLAWPPASPLSRCCPSASLSTDQWLGLGLVVALLACLGLAVAVLALAREVGMLRLRLGPAAALEIPEEGPELGRAGRTRSSASTRPGDASLALAVFTSEGCRVCRGLEPAIAALADDPAVAIRRSTRSQTATCGPSSRSRAARSRSPSIRAAPCSPRGPSTTSPSSRACSRPPSGAGRAWSRAAASRVAERDRVGEALESLAGDTSRRGFLARVGAGAAGGDRRAASSPRR